jgi:putative transposase
LSYVRAMKLILQIKLKPDTEQKESLLDTIEEANKACNELSGYAFEKKLFNHFKLHKAKYYSIRSSFNLSAQMVIRCISKVSDSYKLNKKKRHTFKELGAITYDERILSYNIEKRIASIWSVGGRLKTPFLPYPEKYLPFVKGEADLIYRKGKFFLFQTCEIPEEEIKDVEEFLGIDFGQKTIASCSDGTSFSSKELNDYREKRFKVRKSIQSKCTKNSKKLLKRLSGKEKTFAKITNHTIAKRIIGKAKESGKGIAIEDLSGIRQTARIRKSQNRTMSNWSFYQLRQFLEYKAKLAGVPLVIVEPQYTSQTCSSCFHIGKRNGKDFRCINGNCSVDILDADYNASKNISILGGIIDCHDKSRIFSCVLHN